MASVRQLKISKRARQPKLIGEKLARSLKRQVVIMKGPQPMKAQRPQLRIVEMCRSAKTPELITISPSSSIDEPQPQTKPILAYQDVTMFYTDEQSRKSANANHGDSATRRYRASEGMDLTSMLRNDADGLRITCARLRENANELYAERKELQDEIDILRSDIKAMGMMEGEEFLMIRSWLNELREEKDKLLDEVISFNLEKERACADLIVTERNADDLLKENHTLKNKIRLLELENMDFNGGIGEVGWPRRQSEEWTAIRYNRERDNSSV